MQNTYDKGFSLFRWLTKTFNKKKYYDRYKQIDTSIIRTHFYWAFNVSLWYIPPSGCVILTHKTHFVSKNVPKAGRLRGLRIGQETHPIEVFSQAHLVAYAPRRVRTSSYRFNASRNHVGLPSLRYSDCIIASNYFFKAKNNCFTPLRPCGWLAMIQSA